MKGKNLDWLDYTLFLMIANAESTDYYLSEEEITVILEKTKLLVVKFANAGMPEENLNVEQKFNTVFERYNALGDEAPEGKMDEHVQQEVNTAAAYLKNQDWFTPAIAKKLINDLVAIAHSDGEFDTNEKTAIKTIAKLWNV